MLLDGTSARLERAKAHAALGNVDIALALAVECHADGLAASLRRGLAPGELRLEGSETLFRAPIPGCA